jgi:hypothetical protein
LQTSEFHTGQELQHKFGCEFPENKKVKSYFSHKEKNTPGTQET